MSRGVARRAAGHIAALCIFLVALLGPRVAHAHAIGLSTGEYGATTGVLTAKLVLARGELLGLVPALDLDRDGELGSEELARGKSAASPLFAHLAVTQQGAPCVATLDALTPTEQDGVTLAGHFDCAGAKPGAFTLRFGLLEDLPRGHRHLARELGGAGREDILFGKNDTFTVGAAAPVGAGGGSGAASSAGPTRGPAGFLGFCWMGVEHILTGYDHLVFLFGLVLVRGRPRCLLTVITAFTLAHSVTLGLSVLGVWAPSPRFVEPAIALSIAYVGLENFFVPDARRRWRVTFPFGLVHGFGFAGALRELDLPRARVPVALVSFNVGVELAQIGVLLVMVPLVLLLTRRHTAPRVMRALSACVAAAGLAWFVARVAG